MSLLCRTSLSLLRRSAARSYHTTNLLRGAGGAGPPTAPFQRQPPRVEKLPENYDCAWDDGVAPELALDFDAHMISSREALLTTCSVFFAFFLLFKAFQYGIDWEVQNPALPRELDCVGEDYESTMKAAYYEWLENKKK